MRIRIWKRIKSRSKKRLAGLFPRLVYCCTLCIIAWGAALCAADAPAPAIVPKGDVTKYSFANSRVPVSPADSAIDVVAGSTFVGRDPDRHIRFQILRDTSRF